MFIQPTGDTTGESDTAAIMNALSAFSPVGGTAGDLTDCVCGCPADFHTHVRRRGGTDCGYCGREVCPAYRLNLPRTGFLAGLLKLLPWR